MCELKERERKVGVSLQGKLCPSQTVIVVTEEYVSIEII